MKKEINLNNGFVCYVDDFNFEKISKYKWTVSTPKKGKYKYAIRMSKEKPRKMIYMHREITSCPNNMLVDHKNGNGLDNTVENLRICTRSNNMMNSIKPEGFSSKYKGVIWHKLNKKWMSRIKLNGKVYYLGYFKKEEDAAKAYLDKAKELFGEYAKK